MFCNPRRHACPYPHRCSHKTSAPAARARCAVASELPLSMTRIREKPCRRKFRTTSAMVASSFNAGMTTRQESRNALLRVAPRSFRSPTVAITMVRVATRGCIPELEKVSLNGPTHALVLAPHDIGREIANTAVHCLTIVCGLLHFRHLFPATATRVLVASFSGRGTFSYFNLAAAFRIGTAVDFAFFESRTSHPLSSSFLNLSRRIRSQRLSKLAATNPAMPMPASSWLNATVMKMKVVSALTAPTTNASHEP